jgi:hypothetical protein
MDLMGVNDEKRKNNTQPTSLETVMGATHAE